MSRYLTAQHDCTIARFMSHYSMRADDVWAGIAGRQLASPAALGRLSTPERLVRHTSEQDELHSYHNSPRVVLAATKSSPRILGLAQRIYDEGGVELKRDGVAGTRGEVGPSLLLSASLLCEEFCAANGRRMRSGRVASPLRSGLTSRGQGKIGRGRTAQSGDGRSGRKASSGRKYPTSSLA